MRPVNRDTTNPLIIYHATPVKESREYKLLDSLTPRAFEVCVIFVVVVVVIAASILAPSLAPFSYRFATLPHLYLPPPEVRKTFVWTQRNICACPSPATPKIFSFTPTLTQSPAHDHVHQSH